MVSDVAEVEIPCGFIGQQHRRVIRQSPGDRRPLVLAAGQFAGQMAGALAESDLVEQFKAPPPTRALGLSGIEQRHFHVLQQRQMRNELERLEHEPKPQTSDHRQPLIIETGHVLAHQVI